MIVVQNSKLSTIVIWASVVVIFLLLGMLALMAGVMYSKQVKLERSLEQVSPQLAEKTVESPGEQPKSQPEPAQKKNETEKKLAEVDVKTIYVLINGKLVPLEVAPVKEEGLSDEAKLSKGAAELHKELMKQQTSTVAVNVELAKAPVARQAGNLDTGDMANRVMLNQNEIEQAPQPENIQQLQRVALMAAYQQRKQKEVAKVLRDAEKAKKEERFIRVKPGDSLWRIAVRAYGNGFMYKKILAANPQIRNPNNLTVGMLLRVPE